jgi:hypothetical protein
MNNDSWKVREGEGDVEDSTAPHSAKSLVLDEFPTTRRRTVRTTLFDRDGTMYVELRTYHHREGEEPFPGRKALTCRLSAAPDLYKAAQMILRKWNQQQALLKRKGT